MHMCMEIFLSVGKVVVCDAFDPIKFCCHLRPFPLPLFPQRGGEGSPRGDKECPPYALENIKGGRGGTREGHPLNEDKLAKAFSLGHQRSVLEDDEGSPLV